MKRIDLIIVDVVTFVFMVIVVGFGFQTIFLLKFAARNESLLHCIVTAMIPTGFAKIWWDNSKKMWEEFSK